MEAVENRICVKASIPIPENEKIPNSENRASDKFRGIQKCVPVLENSLVCKDVKIMEKPMCRDIPSEAIVIIKDIMSKLPSKNRQKSPTSIRANVFSAKGMNFLKCKFCGKQYGNRWALAAHIKIHIGKKFRQDQICSQAFKQQANLQIRMHHKHCLSGTNLPGQRRRRGRPPIKRFVDIQQSIPQPVYENPFEKHNDTKLLGGCEVRLNKVDLNHKKPMSSTLLLQKLNNMVETSNGNKNLFLKVPAEGNEYCITKMNADLIGYFLQPMPLPTSISDSLASTSSGYSSSSFPSPSSQEQQPYPELSLPSHSFPITERALSASSLMKNTEVHIKDSSKAQSEKPIKKFKCTKCRRFFELKASLIFHDLLRHPNNPSTFSHVDSKKQKVHNKVGSKSLQIQCRDCQKIFKTPNSLRIHIRLHTKEKPCQCKICGVRYTQGSSLMYHMRKHTKEETLQSNKCDEKSTRLPSISVHEKKPHSEVVNTEYLNSEDLSSTQTPILQ